MPLCTLFRANPVTNLLVETTESMNQYHLIFRAFETYLIQCSAITGLDNFL